MTEEGETVPTVYISADSDKRYNILERRLITGLRCVSEKPQALKVIYNMRKITVR